MAKLAVETLLDNHRKMTIFDSTVAMLIRHPELHLVAGFSDCGGFSFEVFDNNRIVFTRSGMIIDLSPSEHVQLSIGSTLEAYPDDKSSFTIRAVPDDYQLSN